MRDCYVIAGVYYTHLHLTGDSLIDYLHIFQNNTEMINYDWPNEYNIFNILIVVCFKLQWSIPSSCESSGDDKRW